MADEQPQKSNNPPSGGGGGKGNNRRYFRRRNKGAASAANSGGEGQGSASQPKDQSRAQTDPKPQGSRPPDQRNEQQEKRRKRRRSNNNNSGNGNSNNTSGNSNNRRSSSSRRQRRDEQANSAPPVAPETERYREPIDVYVHTHIVRPAYRDASSDYVSETSFLAGRRPPEASIHMERLQEEINGHLDEYFNRPKIAVKVIREAGDEDWDNED